MGGLERGFGPSKKSHWLNELYNKVAAGGKMPLMRESNLFSQSPYNHLFSFYYLQYSYSHYYIQYISMFNECMVDCKELIVR